MGLTNKKTNGSDNKNQTQQPQQNSNSAASVPNDRMFDETWKNLHSQPYYQHYRHYQQPAGSVPPTDPSSRVAPLINHFMSEYSNRRDFNMGNWSSDRCSMFQLKEIIMEHKFSEYYTLEEIKDCLEDTLGEAEMWADQVACEIINSGAKSIDPIVIEAVLSTAVKDSDWLRAKEVAKTLYAEVDGLEKAVEEIERQDCAWVRTRAQYWLEEYTKLNK